jgi:hypothetical protein
MMTHKIVTIDIRGKKHFPYLEEHVNFQNSVSQIQTLLQKYQCDQIATAQKQVTDTKHGSFTVHSLAFIVRGERFLIEFPVIYIRNSQRTTLRMDISGRVVFHKLKALLIDVEIGYLDFMEAMMPYRVITLPDGRQMPLVDYVIQHGTELSAGTADLLALPGGRP